MRKKLHDERKRKNTFDLNQIFIQNHACIFALRKKTGTNSVYKIEKASNTNTNNRILHSFWHYIFCPNVENGDQNVNHKKLSIDF